MRNPFKVDLRPDRPRGKGTAFRRARYEELEPRLYLHEDDGDGHVDDSGQPEWLDHYNDDNAFLDQLLTADPSQLAQLASAAPSIAAGPDAAGQWGPLQNAPIEFINALMLPTGKVLGYDRTLNLRLWDPATNVFTTPADPGYNLFCTGMSLLADGTALVSGGHVVDQVGLPFASIYDPFHDTWTQLPNMNGGRWYPSSTTLANGNVLVLSGDTNGNTVNPLPQIYDVTAGHWIDLTTAIQSMSFYPRTFSAPNGDAFVAGPDQLSQYLDTSGTGLWIPVANRIEPYRSYGSAVMYAPGKVLYVGGGSPATNSAEIIDLNQPNPTWQSVAPMAFARRNSNATLLPNGQVLITGGNTGSSNYDGDASTAAEIWDPTTQTFTTVASESDVRWYHSTALLLPDGRVMSGSGDLHLTQQVYSPPYLFAGARPTISSAPETVRYADNFFVGTPDAASITSVRWIRLGTATHAQNWDQYAQSASFSHVSGGLMVSAPPTPNSAPPGYYMLFVLNGNVPSVAKVVRVAPTLTALSVSDVSVTEGPNSSTVNAVFTVSLSLASAQTITVAYATGGGSAVAGQDYTGQSGTLTFSPLVKTQTVTVPILGDGVNESNEDFNLTLASPGNAILAKAQGQGLIRDFASLPVITIQSTSLVEADSLTSSAVFAVTLSAVSAQTVTVSYVTQNATAIAPADYANTGGILTFSPGVTQQFITVAVVGDTIDEDNDQFYVSLSAPQNAALDVAQAACVIVNNDTPVTANLPTFATFTEPAAGATANVMVTASLSGPSGKTVVLPWITRQDGTAVDGKNFYVQLGAVTFNPGETIKTITIPITGDMVKTPDMTFAMYLQSELLNANYGNRYDFLVIDDNDPLPGVSIADASLQEGNTGSKSMVFTATLTAPVAQQVTVAYQTSAGTATVGSDYTQTNGAITFAPNATTQTITVTTSGDSTAESNETFNLTLSNPSGAVLTGAKAIGTIVDDDGAPVPTTPSNLTATVGFAAAVLTWQASAGASSYNIYRGTNAGGEGTTPIATGVVGTTFTDNLLVNGATYYYRVAAVKTQTGNPYESSRSNEISVVPSAYMFSDPITNRPGLLQLNGLNIEYVQSFGANLQLTDGGTNQTDSVFTLNPVKVSGFRTQFTFQQTPSFGYTGALGGGLTFTIQRAGPTALGTADAGLGYGGIANSMAVKFDLANNAGEGVNSTGLYSGGAMPTSANSINLNGTGIDLHSGHLFSVDMTYDGAMLTVTITDTVTQAQATQQYNVDIPTLVSGNTAYVGFTGSTGALTAVQRIPSWAFTPAPVEPSNLLITSGTSTPVQLSWTNNDPNATSVLIERKTTAGAYAPIGSTNSAGASTYLDATAVQGTGYVYRVRSVNNGSTSLSSNEASVNIASPHADLQITLSDSQASIAPGAAVIYTIVVSNLGPDSISGASVVDALPALLTGVSYTAVATGGASGFTASGNGNINDTVNLPVSASITYTIHAVLSPLASGTLQNTAGVTTSIGATETNTNNNSATDSDSIAAAPVINFPAGFAGAGGQFTYNGPTAALVGSQLQITNATAQQADSIFYTTPVNVARFTTEFDIQLLNGSDPSADGMTFTIQGAAPTALGLSGGNLGFGGIWDRSLAVKFDLYDNEGEGFSSTGLYLFGATPGPTGSIDLLTSGIDFHSQHVFHVSMAYDGLLLTVTIVDATTLAQATQQYTIDIPGIVGGNAAFVGFTGSTGGATAVQNVLDWIYIPGPAAPSSLLASSTSATSAQLSWANNDLNATAVLIERKTGIGGTYQQIGVTPSASTNTFLDTTVVAGAEYYYRVRATHQDSTSSYSNEANVTTLGPSQVTSRLLFYDRSFYTNPANDPGFTHDTAIATNIVALLPGAGKSTFANVSAYYHGINGIMVDLSADSVHAAISASDFAFKTSGIGAFGASNDPSTWTTLEITPSVLVRMGAGTGGSDRIELTWPDGTILSTWLAVTVKAGNHTELPADDIFFFGSAPGEVGNDTDTDFRYTDVLDQSHIRLHSNLANSDLYYNLGLDAAIANVDDVNRDSQVDVLDQVVARQFSYFPFNELDMIQIPIGGPFAPVPPPALSAIAPALAVKTAAIDLSQMVSARVANQIDAHSLPTNASINPPGLLMQANSRSRGTGGPVIHPLDSVFTDEAALEELLAEMGFE